MGASAVCVVETLYHASILYWMTLYPIIIGDRVAIEPGQSCRLCSFCKEGQYNICPDVKFGSCPPKDGFLAQYVTHPADLCYK